MEANNDTKKPTQKQLFEKLIWDIDDVCQFLGINRNHARVLVHRGKLPARKLTRRLHFIPEEVLEAYRTAKRI